jgi:serine/threonine protein kinase
MFPGVEPLLQSDPTSFGGWTLLGRLGKGGFSDIFLGEKEGQLSAIKMIRKELLSEPKVFERFATEINNLEKLTHPGIARLIEDDLSTDIPYIAMEFVQGKTLEQKVIEEGPLNEEEWLKVLESISETLDYCHSMGIIHKDIGPGNIMLNNSGPMLIDFGISYELGSTRITQDDQIVGTPSYMSPEHLNGQISESMDIFGLGSTFVFAGTGIEPFGDESKSQTRTSITFEMPKLDGLSNLQLELIQPLLYKKITDRPTLKQLLKGINSWRETGIIGDYVSFLKNREKKLTSRRIDLKKQKRNLYVFRTLQAFAVSTLIAIGSILILAQTSEDGSNFSNNGSESVPTASTSGRPSVDPSQSSDNIISKIKDPKGLSGQCATLFLAHEEQALDICKAASELGDGRSSYYAGAVYDENGDDKNAAIYYKKAISLYPDDTKSMVGLVQIYIDTKDDLNYAKWVKTCALYEIKTPSGARCKLLYGMDLVDDGKIAEGIAYLSDAFDWGESAAANFLGAYFNDRGDTKNAILWLTKSAEAGDPRGIGFLQNITYETKQFDIWKKWTLISANKGNVKDMGKLALYAAIGDKDYSTAKKWGLKGAQEGDDVAMFALGYAYWKGDRDFVNAKTWLAKSASKGNELATRSLGDIFRLEKDYPNSAIWYSKGATLGDLTSSYFASLVYLSGLNDEITGCQFVNKTIELADSIRKTRKLTDDEQSHFEEIQNTKAFLCN